MLPNMSGEGGAGRNRKEKEREGGGEARGQREGAFTTNSGRERNGGGGVGFHSQESIAPLAYSSEHPSSPRWLSNPPPPAAGL